MKRLAIHFRLLIAAFLLICATTFVLDMVGVQITKKFMLKRFRQRISFLAGYLADNAEVGVLMSDKTGLKTLALNLLGEEDVAKVTIFDEKHSPLVELSRVVPGPLSTVEAPVTFKSLHGENVLYDTLDMPFGALKKPGIKYIGKVRIDFSTHGINSLIGKITLQFIWVSVGLAILAGVMFYIISLSIVRDVTRLANAARRVGEGNLELRAEPGNLPETRELALAFNAMLESLARSRKALLKANQEMARHQALAEVGKFSLMVAHEVKNPLGIIKSSLDVLKKDRKLPPDDTMIVYMEDEIRRLNKIIEDFLMFSRPAEPVFRRVDLNEMARDIVSRFEIQNAEAHIKLEVRIESDSCFANVDQDLLIRALGNIVKNAYDANRGKGVVRITSGGACGEWFFKVEDHGEGIPHENRQKIFEPFFTTKSRGTGLGLAFAAQVIKAHAGSVSIENSSPEGTLFVVRIPKDKNKDSQVQDPGVRKG